MAIEQNNPLEKIEKMAAKGWEFGDFISFEIRAAQVESAQELYVEGVAVVFNKPTVRYEFDGIEYKEQVDRLAFADCDMSDVIFNYNHSGKVVARTRNKTLQLKIENDGLHMRGRLDGTKQGRELFEEIKGGYIDRMSYAYKVDEATYDTKTHMRTLLKIKKLYDVSAVDIPAYDTTSIYTRSLLDLDKFERERLESLSLRKRKLDLSIKTIIGGNG